jgi:BON domain
MKARVCHQLAAVALCVALGLAAGCAKAPDDNKIASAIQASLNADSGLQGKQLTVQSANGTVTLSGTVDNDAEREAASRYAAAAPGVKQVVNNLQIGGASTATEPAAVPAPVAEQSAERPLPKPTPTRRHRRERRDFSDDHSGSDAQIAQAVQDQPSPPPMTTSAPAAPPIAPTPPPPPPPRKVTIPSGTTVAVRLVDAIDSETAQPGQTFHATLNSPLAVEGDVAIPVGYDVEGHVVDVKSAGKFAGKSELTLQLDRIAVGGKYYNITTDTYHREGSSRGKNTAEKVGAGGVIGAIIGGIAGGGKGAAIGAAAGGGIGGGVQAATKSQQIKLPSEFVLNFTLQSSLTVMPTAKSPHEDHPRLESNNP